VLVFAICEPEVRGDLLTLGAFVLVAYLGWYWAAVLRGPAGVRGRALATWGIGVVAGGVSASRALSEAAFLLAGVVGAVAVAVGLILLARWPSPVRLVASAILGALTPTALLVVVLGIGIGSGSTCLD
jgi:hypothetical protein